MKSSIVAGILALATSIPIQAVAQDQSLASTIDVYVFPTEGQDGRQQSTDEAACYEWAVSNTGSDPFDLAKQQHANAQQSQAELEAAQEVGRGAGAGGFVGGAAAGALIGEIANDDAAEGAAWGAGLGAIASRRAGKHAREQAAAETTRQAESRETSTAEQVENFKKAFSVCLEAKKYLVKY
ncbi:MAG TPA: hypothetical protein VF339_11555 [Gammaproteobacteria bacterium]